MLFKGPLSYREDNLFSFSLNFILAQFKFIPGGCGKVGRFATSKKGDFLTDFWQRFFNTRYLTDSGISHRFFVLIFLFTQIFADLNIYTSVEYLHRC